MKIRNDTPWNASLPRIIVCCCAVTLPMFLFQSVQASPPTGTNWGLIFADEFGGTSVDTQKWVTQYPWGPTHTSSDMTYMQAQNLSVGQRSVD